MLIDWPDTEGKTDLQCKHAGHADIESQDDYLIRQPMTRGLADDHSWKVFHTSHSEDTSYCSTGPALSVKAVVRGSRSHSSRFAVQSFHNNMRTDPVETAATFALLFLYHVNVTCAQPAAPSMDPVETTMRFLGDCCEGWQADRSTGCGGISRFCCTS